MALRIKKLRFPKELATTDYKIFLESVGVSKDGEPITDFENEGKCIFSEKSKRIIDSEGRQITLLGKIAIEGDIVPSMKQIASGKAIINEVTYEIYASYRPRNPDGSVFATEFDLM